MYKKIQLHLVQAILSLRIFGEEANEGWAWFDVVLRTSRYSRTVLFCIAHSDFPCHRSNGLIQQNGYDSVALYSTAHAAYSSAHGPLS